MVSGSILGLTNLHIDKTMLVYTLFRCICDKKIQLCRVLDIMWTSLGISYNMNDIIKTKRNIDREMKWKHY